MALYSMTGFGRSEGSVGPRQVSVEVKSLNGKQMELNTRLSPLLRPYELDLRSLVNTSLLRGTVDVTINIRQDGASRPMSVNTSLAKAYYDAIKQIGEELSLPQEHILPTLMRMPEVVSQDMDVLPEHDWLEVKVLVQNAVRQLMQHRKDEGAMLETELILRIKNIMELLEKVKPLEPERMERLRQRLAQSLQSANVNNDANRFEQELIFYLEKMDFSEEQVRLLQHCNYFLETLQKEDHSKGKLLGFILQEVGREVNTLGAKANHATIQQIVVSMKDELEKAKEQVLNVL